MCYAIVARVSTTKKNQNNNKDIFSKGRDLLLPGMTYTINITDRGNNFFSIYIVSIQFLPEIHVSLLPLIMNRYCGLYEPV